MSESFCFEEIGKQPNVYNKLYLPLLAQYQYISAHVNSALISRGTRDKEE